MAYFLLPGFVLIGVILFSYARMRAISLSATSDIKLHSRPAFHGGAFLVFALLPAVFVWMIAEILRQSVLGYMLSEKFSEQATQLSGFEHKTALNDMFQLSQGGFISSLTETVENGAAYYSSIDLNYSIISLLIIFAVLAAGTLIFLKRQSVTFRARHVVERAIMAGLFSASGIAVLTTLGIFLSVIFESLRFFETVPVFDFLFGTQWSPQTALRADQVGSTGAFGAIPLFAGTALITVIAMCVAVPVGLAAAIYLSDYASPRFRSFAKPILEILAGIPTVVYGFFAALTVAPFIRNSTESIGFTASSESALAAGIVMGIMIIPFISSLSDDVINAVPQSLRDGSYGLGATKSETIRQVVLPAALPGIVSAILLAVSRAIGETMIVVMAAGQSANLTANPFDAVTTVTVQIVALLTGDTEFDSPKTLSAFALGLVLFLITLALNFYALRVVKKYREQYD